MDINIKLRFNLTPWHKIFCPTCQLCQLLNYINCTEIAYLLQCSLIVTSCEVQIKVRNVYQNTLEVTWASLEGFAAILCTYISMYYWRPPDIAIFPLSQSIKRIFPSLKSISLLATFVALFTHMRLVNSQNTLTFLRNWQQCWYPSTFWEGLRLALGPSRSMPAYQPIPETYRFPNLVLRGDIFIFNSQKCLHFQRRWHTQVSLSPSVWNVFLRLLPNLQLLFLRSLPTTLPNQSRICECCSNQNKAFIFKHSVISLNTHLLKIYFRLKPSKKCHVISC